MSRRIAASLIGIIALVSPLTASAQPTSNDQLIALLTQLVQMLEQELQQLIALHGQGTISTTPPSAANFTATPASGPAPLMVNFNATGLNSGSNYEIAYGDGASDNLTLTYPPCAFGTNCGPIANAAHTYQSAGTYTATLYLLIPGGCPNSSLSCLGAPAQEQNIGTVTITVTGNSQSGFNAYPTSGSAPLTVNFWYGLGDNSATGYTITFGDGTSAVPSIGCAVNPLSGTGICPRGLVATHTYAAAGTYTATLMPPQPYCPAGASCPAVAPLTVMITVTGGCTSNCGSPVSFTANPASGTAPLTVTFSPSASIPGYYAVNFGDGTSASMQQGSISHTYQSTGTYTASFESDAACLHSSPSCEIAQQSYGNVSIIVSGQSTQNITFSANPASGSEPLTVTFTPNGPAGYYAVNFGDGTSASLQQGSVSHTYSIAGTYTATFMSDAPCLHSSPACAIAQTSYGTVLVTVNSGVTSNGSFSASPTSGSAPLTVNFWYGLGNNSATGYTVTFGDGSSVVPSIGCAVNPLSGTGACPRGLVATHTYAAAGTYTATLEYTPSCTGVECTAILERVATVNINVDAQTISPSGSQTISSSGSQTLSP